MALLFLARRNNEIVGGLLGKSLPGLPLVLLKKSLVQKAMVSTTTASRLPTLADPESKEEKKPLCQELKISSAYLGSFPHLSREELEEPPPRVSAPVRRILENSKVRYVDGKRIRAKYNARKVAYLRKKYIAAGYYWPEKPMRDRNLDRTPAGGIREKRKEERKKRIEEALLKMPEIVAEYRKRIHVLREKRRQDKIKNKVKLDKIKAMGLHPNDPRAKRILYDGTFGEDKKKDKTRTKKKFQRKAK